MPFESKLKSLKKLHQGKVRDIYEVDPEHILIVASDRISAFDVVLPDTIPRKGGVLTTLSNFWLRRFSNEIRNHLSDIRIEDVVNDSSDLKRLQNQGRSIIVRRLQALPFEAIVRGYVIGSGWKEYQRTGAICGVKLPPNLKLAQQLEAPIFTPSTKAQVGQHDMNVSFAEIVGLVGSDVAAAVRDASLRIYQKAASYAHARGIIIADTKFEFGLDEDGEIVLIDEVLTPDSSRFWPRESYRPGNNPKSFDKQYVRDYLETLNWDKKSPVPHNLPEEIIKNTSNKYLHAHEILYEITMDQVRSAIKNATKYRADAVIKLTPEGKAADLQEQRFVDVRNAFEGKQQTTVEDLTLRVVNRVHGIKALQKYPQYDPVVRRIKFAHDRAVGGFVRRGYGELITE